MFTRFERRNMKVLNWQVAGSGTITGGSFSYITTCPGYTGGNLLPDPVTKTNGFDFNVTAVINVNESVYVTIELNGTITKTVSASGGNASLSSSELSGYTSNSGFMIRLSFFNYSRITFNSQQYGINSNRTYQKKSLI